MACPFTVRESPAQTPIEIIESFRMFAIGAGSKQSIIWSYTDGQGALGYAVKYSVTEPKFRSNGPGIYLVFSFNGHIKCPSPDVVHL